MMISRDYCRELGAGLGDRMRRSVVVVKNVRRRKGRIILPLNGLIERRANLTSDVAKMSLLMKM
jgi:hypothetical protein